MKRLRMALIGGGGKAFIGKVHAIAATLDGQAELVAGALSSDPERARAAADSFGIARDRAYGSYSELLAAEAALPADQRVDFVSIATPNHTHYAIARDALQAGFHVFCDKPLTTSLADARHLAQVVRETGRTFVLTHNYTGYPLVRQAREMIRQGELGEILAVRVQYIQGWLHGLPPGETPARGAWKADPVLAGPSGAMGDIGTHAYNLACYVSGLTARRLTCRLRTFRDDRSLDDYGQVWIEWDGAAQGSLTASQISHGRANDLVLEVDGQRGSLSWRQEEPNVMEVRRHGQPRAVYERHPHSEYLATPARAAARIPAGHPEGFLEAFANVYRAGFAALQADPSVSEAGDGIFPTVDDGVAGVRFIEQCVASNAADGQVVLL